MRTSRPGSHLVAFIVLRTAAPRVAGVAHRALGALACSALACATPQPSPQAPAVATGIDSALASPNLDPVPDPETLLVSGRLANPGAALAKVRPWSTLPMPQSEQITQLLVGRAVGPVVDIGEPIDFAVIADGAAPTRALFAVSAAVKDAGAAKAALSRDHELVAAKNGVLLVPGQEASDGDRDRQACELAPAYGAAPMRLVCGSSPAALSELGPWLTRTATRRASSADVHIEMRRQPIHATSDGKEIAARAADAVLAPWAGMLQPDGLAGSLRTDLADFIADLDAASLDVRIDGAGASITATLNLAGSKSTLGRLAAAHPERSAAPPQAFWQLPVAGNTDFAFFDRGIDASELERWRDRLLEQVALEGTEGVATKSLLQALFKLPSASPIAYASGADSDAMARAFAVQELLRPGPDRDEASRVATEALLGWHLLEIDEPPARLTAALKEFEVSWDHLADAERANHRTLATHRSAPIPGRLRAQKGVQHWVWEVPWENPEDFVGGCLDPSTRARVVAGCPPERPRKPLAVHLLLVPDGDRTWLGLGGDEAVVTSKLVAALDVGGNLPAMPPELASLKSASVGAAGFVTVRGLLEGCLLEKLALGGQPRDAFPISKWFLRAPSRWTTPVVFSVTADPKTDTSPIRATLRMSPGMVDDVLHAMAGDP